MSEAVAYQYLQPLTYAIFALGFGFVWFYIRSLSAAGYFALAFLCGASASVLEILRDSLSVQSASYIILTAYTATACLLTAGLAARANEPPPSKMMAALVAGLFVLFVIFWEVYESIAMRMFVANFLNAAILAFPLTFLRNRRHIIIDRVLFWLLIVIVAQFAIRTLVTLYLDWGVLSVEAYPSSIVGVSFRFTTALAGIALAVTLYVALGIDIVYTLKKQSTTDAMTGLRNRAGFEEKARKLIIQASAERRPLSLIITDLDHFKQVNDTLGHTTGDIVIGFYGRILGNMARKSDLAGRVGGEEFCVMLTDCAIDDATELAEAVRQSFCETVVPGVEPEIRCSASFGIATLRGDEPFSDLYKRADEALYQAKNAGRNRVSVIDNYNWRPTVDAPPLQPDMMRRARDQVTATAES